MTRRVVRAAPAKLNLFLEVLARRPDGYHELDSVFTAIDLHDTVELTVADDISIEVLEGAAPADENNLAWRAAREFFGTSGGGVHIRLTKRIPSGAGLGGGSSDAAAVLLGMHDLFDRPLDSEALLNSARRLGADVPFFLNGGLARCGGIGDVVAPIEPAPTVAFVLISPDFACETPQVFAGLAAARESTGLIENPHSARVFLEEYTAKAGSGDGVPYFNRLQATAERDDPRLLAVREDAEVRFGLRFTMTGSGSSYFAEIGADFGNLPAAWNVHGIGVNPRIVQTASS
jgi:4-diphosphocytidyl-2-C-methyl-D-erythritol kinase